MLPIVKIDEPAETEADHPFNQAVALQLRLQRTLVGKSLADVARETGIAYDPLGRYMNGGRPIRVATLAQICRALETTPGDIIDRAQTALDG